MAVETEAYNEETGKLTYHYLLGGEFFGDSAMDIVLALYKNSIEEINDKTFDSWAEYQIDICKKYYGAEVTGIVSEEEAQQFLDILVKNGGLEVGPLKDNRLGMELI